MKKTKRLKLTVFQYLTHYEMVLLLLVVVFYTGWSLLEIFVTNTYSGVRSSEELITGTLPFLLGAILCFLIQHRKLRFREFTVFYTESQFKEAIERTAKELEWRIITNSKTFFQARRKGNWTASWGEMITMVKDKEMLLINSICNPDSNKFDDLIWLE